MRPSTSESARRAAHDREEPPFISGLIGTAITRSSAFIQTVLRSIDQRVLVTIWGGGTVAVLLLVVIAGSAATPGVIGMLQALFVGVFAALLFAVGFGVLVVSTRRAPKTKPATLSQAAEAINTRLAPTVEALNDLRQQAIAEMKARSWTRVPIGIVASIVLWVLGRSTSDPPEVPDLILYVVLGALAGEIWAVHAPDRWYRRTYKERVLPLLASGLGSLTYRHASRERVASLGAEWILPPHDSLQADDEIAGTHDGLPLEIVEVRLRRRVNKKSRVVFDGLLVAVTLPRALTATTILVTDRGLWERAKAGWRRGGLERVHLEHAALEDRYDVYSTDQVEARALFTPAFMERLMALADASGFSLPGAMAEGNTLVVALPKRPGTADLFEPPPFWKPAGGAALVRLQHDIRKVLTMADTVIHLDFWASGRQRDARAQRAQPDAAART